MSSDIPQYPASPRPWDGTPPPGAPTPGSGPASPSPEPKKNWFARHKVLTGVGAGVLVLGGIGMIGGGGDDDAAPTAATPPAASQSAASQDGTTEPTAEESTPSEAETSEPAEEAPAADGKSRNAPLPAGSTLTFDMSGGDVQITLGTADWAADAAIAGANQFNEAAPEGSTYVLLPVTITNVTAPEAVTPWIAFQVSYVAPDGRSFDPASVVTPRELVELGDLYEGGTGEGDLAFAIPADATGGVWAVEPLVSFDGPVFVTAG